MSPSHSSLPSWSEHPRRRARRCSWLYGGEGTPGDLGYWVGYRIASAYHGRARDKRAALRTLLEQKDSARILAERGWKPGD